MILVFTFLEEFKTTNSLSHLSREWAVKIVCADKSSYVIYTFMLAASMALKIWVTNFTFIFSKLVGFKGELDNHDAALIG